MKKVIYLAGPYTASSPEEINANVTAAINVQGELMRHGYAVFSPHANYGHGPAGVTYQSVMDMCFAHLSTANLIVMMPGWERSSGSCREIGFAIARNIPVYYWPTDAEQLLSQADGDS